MPTLPCLTGIIITLSLWTPSAPSQASRPSKITGADIVSGRVPLGIQLPNAESKVSISTKGTEIHRAAIFTQGIVAKSYKVLVKIAESTGSMSLYFPFRSQMVKLILHRAGHGGSPSIRRKGDKLPLKGWRIAHKISLRASDTVVFEITVRPDQFSYWYKCLRQPGDADRAMGSSEISQSVQYRHTADSVYDPTHPLGLKTLQNAIVLEADHCTLLDFELKPAASIYQLPHYLVFEGIKSKDEWLKVEAAFSSRIRRSTELPKKMKDSFWFNCPDLVSEIYRKRAMEQLELHMQIEAHDINIALAWLGKQLADKRFQPLDMALEQTAGNGWNYWIHGRPEGKQQYLPVRSSPQKEVRIGTVQKK